MKFGTLNFENASVLVVGDIMLDRYWTGDAGRISPEAPVPVVRINHSEERLGGAANVALNIKALGAKTSLLGIIGDDADGYILEEHLKAANIQSHLKRLAQVPTITKLRVISRHQQMIRLDFEKNLYEVDEGLIEQQCEQISQDITVAILSDYGKGTLKRPHVLIQQLQKKGLRVLVDPKSIDYNDYRGADLITPNMKEFESVVGPCANEQALVDKGRALMKDFDLGALLVTRGERGMTLLQKNETVLHLPASAREVFDVTGAGDTVIATIATALAGGESLERAVYLANVAAGIVVGKLGAATVSLPELHFALEGQSASHCGVVNEDQLLLEINQARLAGEKIVMTNGCFDILHAGHIAYLSEARRLGDRLIIAVNDDASVTRLKGAGRPINQVSARMDVLAGLKMVDWVVPFSEDTPERVIKRVLPDVLVKGGDYRPEEIAGGAAVIAHGGEVRILSFVEGLSTTATIEKLKKLED